MKELGELLGLTSTGIRQHLTVLERDGLIEAQEERGHVGRPALVYSLTDAGDALYPKKYDDLASTLLQELHNLAGSDVVQSLLRRVAVRFAEPYMDRVEGRTLPERAAEITKIISERGCLAELELRGDECLISQHTCPFPNVAKVNSGVCALEVKFVRRLAGTDARLISSILRGDKTCTYRLRAGATSPANVSR